MGQEKQFYSHTWQKIQSKNGKTVWFLVHRQELLKQTIDTFDRFNIPTDKILIGMVATVANHPERYPAPDFIIFDAIFQQLIPGLRL